MGDQGDVARRRVDQISYRFDIIGERYIFVDAPVFAVAWKIGHINRVSIGFEPVGDLVPAPGAMPGTVNKNVVGHCFLRL